MLVDFITWTSELLPYRVWMGVFFVLLPVIVFAGFRSIGLMFLRVFIAFVVGWLLVMVCTDGYWDWRVESLPPDATEAEMRDATADGGPRVGSLILGWLYALCYLLPWIGAWLVLWVLLDHRQSRKGGAE